jgi:WD40-like Beta Propeller Repeat
MAAFTASLAALWLAAGVHAAGAAPRILFRSDWSGTSQIYAADPTGVRPTGQVTFGRAPACGSSACGYHGAAPSPNGRYLVFSDWTSCDPSGHISKLFVSRADGTHRRVLARLRSGPTCGNPINAAWAADSVHIAYNLRTAIHVVRVDGRDDRVVAHGGWFEWSPDGRSIAYTTPPTSNSPLGSLWVVQGGRRRMLADRADNSFAWSPNGRWIEYWFEANGSGQDELDIVHPDGTGRHTLLHGYDVSGAPWSGDSRYLSAETTAGLIVVDVATGETSSVAGEPLAWQPHGHVLALQGSVVGGISLYNPSTNQIRTLVSDRIAEMAWSPDGKSLAYVARSNLFDYFSADLKIASPSGAVRTIVHADGDYGGNISELAWTRSPPGTRYRKPSARVPATVGDDALAAPWPITRIAADGERVAYVSCGHVFVWTPSARSIVQAEPAASLSPRCTTPGNYYAFWIYSLALSGDRIAFGMLEGNTGQSWGLYTGSLSDPSAFDSLDRVYSANGSAVGNGGLGDLIGGGGLLAFSTWRDDYAYPKANTLEQRIQRVDGLGCPCPTIVSSPGPLVPFDTDSGRIVAGGENATVVLDESGRQLASVPVSPLAAQLSGSDLVILVRGQLLDYDAATGGRLHAWPLPDVPSGGECASPHYGTWECGEPRLVLEDAARGLVTYVLDGQVHVLRLADGFDATVGAGTLARFTTAGLVFANDATLRLVAFDRLPVKP